MTTTTTDTDVLDLLIVGAGFAGVHMLRRARERGFDAQVFEAGSGTGGTWFFNRYPGARCDFESFDYSYFDDDLQAEWTWTERYPGQAELLRYLDFVIDRFGLRDGISLEHRVLAAQFDDQAGGIWRVRVATPDGERTVHARHLVLATGSLSAPLTPAIEGIDDFAGDVLYTARWPKENVDLAGKRIALVGTGSSGVQVMPELAREAAELHVLQRTPAYVVESRNRPLDQADMAAFHRDREAYRERALTGVLGVHFPLAGMSAKDADPAEREAALEAAWQRGGSGILGAYADVLVDHESNAFVAEFLRRKIHDTVEDPETAESLTPRTYPVGGKRIVVGTNYHATFNEPHVHLVDLRRTPLERFTERGFVVDGVETEIDALVLATGFDTLTGAILGIDIEGVDGRSLRDEWAAGPVSFLGVHVAGFPNLHLVTGPGSPSVLANLFRAIEQHVDWITGLLDTMRDTGATTVDARANAQETWSETVRDLASGTVMADVDSAFVGANVPGKPRTFLMYAGGVSAYQDVLDGQVAGDYPGLVFDGAQTAVEPDSETARA